MTSRLTRGQVRAVAAGLFIGTVAVLLATTTMGYTRDESFYFDYARGYQDWFVGVEAAQTHAEVKASMDRKTTLHVWKGNFEHPPLMKTAFGYSWRLLARKDRPARVAAGSEADGDAPAARVTSLAPADGFGKGALVLLLGPLQVGQDPTDPARILARGAVVERKARNARVTFPMADAAALRAACDVKPGEDAPPRLMTGCQAREDRALAVLSESTALRLPGMLSAALAVMLTFLLGIELFHWLAGLFGAIAFLFVPRHFLHAHMAAFDMPIVAAMLATLYAFWRARTDRRWALATAVLWGVALTIKHNAFFLPAPLLLYWLWCGRDRLGLLRQGWRLKIQLPPLPLALLVMPVVALPMLFVFWPRLWYDPFVGLFEYFSFHLGHVHYMQVYFGQPLQVPPFPVSFPFGLTLYTVPEVFTALTAVGLFALAPLRTWGPWLRALWRREAPSDRERAVAYALVNGMVPIVLIALPSVPIFGGVKHWMTGLPWLLLIAGYGLSWALLRLTAAVRPRAAGWALAAVAAAVIFAHPVSASINAAAYGTGYYNSLLAGGPQGAADRQMMRMYWGHTSMQALDWLNREAPQNARVYFQNTTHGSYRAYQRDGLLRADIRYAHQQAGSDIALIEPQKSFAHRDIEARESYGVHGPLWNVVWRGVPFLRVYAKPSLGLTPPEGALAAAAPPDAAR